MPVLTDIRMLLDTKKTAPIDYLVETKQKTLVGYLKNSISQECFYFDVKQMRKIIQILCESIKRINFNKKMKTLFI